MTGCISEKEFGVDATAVTCSSGETKTGTVEMRLTAGIFQIEIRGATFSGSSARAQPLHATA